MATPPCSLHSFRILLEGMICAPSAMMSIPSLRAREITASTPDSTAALASNQSVFASPVEPWEKVER